MEIERVLHESRRFEELTRKSMPLKITMTYDGLELDV
jgi:hypothetical protein